MTLRDGGTIAPGDPVTLTLRDSLVWDGGGVIQLVIGADDAGSDHLVVQKLVRGSPGSFTFQFIDDGFTAQDFSFAGLAGSFSLLDGTLGFTAAAVPEPGSVTLLVAGLLIVAWARRRRGSAGPARAAR